MIQGVTVVPKGAIGPRAIRHPSRPIYPAAIPLAPRLFDCYAHLSQMAKNKRISGRLGIDAFIIAEGGSIDPRISDDKWSTETVRWNSNQNYVWVSDVEVLTGAEC